MDIKEQIKNSVSIVDVVERYVSLKPAGKNYKGLCPFHTEKTASFFVMPEKKSYTCYGCHKFGDIFSMIMEMEGISFSESMNFLIDNYNLNVNKSNIRSGISFNDYYGINKLVVKYYRKNLFESDEGENARKYLQKRGINKNTIEEFSVGYALNQWDGLYKYLQKEKIDIRKCLDLGLLVKSEKGKIYDRFRGRVMIPILSESGKVIAFGGRTLFNEPSKYLNSPDSPVYKKSEHLFGFYNTKKNIRDSNKAILVEGYFDFLALYQGGIKNVAASLGTALTMQQIYLLMRFTDNIYVFYDNDKAGENAALRAVELMLEQNISPFVMLNKESKDPDELIKDKGLKRILSLLESSTDGFKYVLDRILSEYDLNNPVSKRTAVSKIMTVIDRVSDPIIREDYIKKVSDTFNIDERLIKNSNGRLISNGDSFNRPLIITPSEMIVISSIVSFPEIIDDIRELFTEELMSVLEGRKIIELLFKFYRKGKETDYNIIQNNLNEQEKILFRDIYLSVKTPNIEKDKVYNELEAAIIKLQDKVNSIKIKEINKKIKMASRNNETHKLQKLMEVKNKFIKNKYFVQEG